ncbi:MAG TPA: extracellular solute-binding protein [Clostridia bacterium]|nr:extracellular solute-binding protein [Clostridia bacterium]
MLAISLILTLAGCSKKQDQGVSLEIWHYYNGAQKIAFDQLIMDFNETLGLEKDIIVEAFSQGNIGQLEGKIIESIDQRVGASDVPNMITTYSGIAYTLDQRGIVANLEDYITDAEINEYVDSYIEEGRLGEDKQFKIFPTAKATEILMVNKTDWDQFAAATGAKTGDLATWEGISRIAELYYNWTDSLTEEKNDGKSFFGRDALANYMLVGSKQLGKEIFQVKEGEATSNLDHDIMRKLWDNYYIPYISGYYSSFGRFSSDDAKTGEIIALVGSTTGAAYFPDNVTIEDNDSYNIELLVLPLPNFENTSLDAVQQGAGIVVLKSDEVQEQASVEFLKWLTEESRNLRFSIETGYLPVKKAAYIPEIVEKELEEMSKQGLSKQLQMTIPLAMEQVKEYDLYISKAFNQEGKARAVLESALDEKAKIDRQKVIELMNQGMTHEEAVEEFSSDKDFREWLLEFEENLAGAVRE